MCVPCCIPYSLPTEGYDPCAPLDCCPPCDPCNPCCDPCDPFSSSCPGPSTTVKRCRSCEIRGGILYLRCDCIKRNGLQHDCPRRLCQGKSCCLTKPEPMCCPSEHARRLSSFPAKKTDGMSPDSSSNVMCPRPSIPCSMPPPSFQTCGPCMPVNPGSTYATMCPPCFPCGPCFPCDSSCEPCGPCVPFDSICPPDAGSPVACGAFSCPSV